MSGILNIYNPEHYSLARPKTIKLPKAEVPAAPGRDDLFAADRPVVPVKKSFMPDFSFSPNYTFTKSGGYSKEDYYIEALIRTNGAIKEIGGSAKGSRESYINGENEELMWGQDCLIDGYISGKKTRFSCGIELMEYNTVTKYDLYNADVARLTKHRLFLDHSLNLNNTQLQFKAGYKKGGINCIQGGGVWNRRQPYSLKLVGYEAGFTVNTARGRFTRLSFSYDGQIAYSKLLAINGYENALGYKPGESVWDNQWNKFQSGGSYEVSKLLTLSGEIGADNYKENPERYTYKLPEDKSVYNLNLGVEIKPLPDLEIAASIGADKEDLNLEPCAQYVGNTGLKVSYKESYIEYKGFTPALDSLDYKKVAERNISVGAAIPFWKAQLNLGGYYNSGEEEKWGITISISNRKADKKSLSYATPNINFCYKQENNYEELTKIAKEEMIRSIESHDPDAPQIAANYFAQNVVYLKQEIVDETDVKFHPQTTLSTLTGDCSDQADAIRYLFMRHGNRKYKAYVLTYGLKGLNSGHGITLIHDIDRDKWQAIEYGRVWTVTGIHSSDTLHQIAYKTLAQGSGAYNWEYYGLYNDYYAYCVMGLDQCREAYYEKRINIPDSPAKPFTQIKPAIGIKELVGDKF
ncbi:hypothetical protein ACFL57_00140 [Candidatus Margulisiibacteriota bacterium]